jgi:thymidylate kinase
VRTAAALPAPLEDLFGALGRERVRWTLLRPRELLQLSEGDVDVLVEPAARGRVENLLASLGFVHMPIPGPDLHAAIHDADAGRFVWMHFQTALELAGAVFAAEDVLAAATPERPPQPADEWLLWILLLRALVDKGVLPQRHREHVSALARRWRGGPPPLEALARRHELDPAEIVALAAAEDWDGLLRHSVHRHPAAPPLPARMRAYLLELRHLRHRRGLSVAVVGPDGAGKTTLVEGLAASLPLPTRIQYMGLTGGRMPKADALRVPGLVLCARVAILWLRYLRASLHLARGRIVLFDRYILDGAVPSGMRLSLAGRMSRRLQRRACPMPDLVILLDASGTTMHARSGEYEPAVLDTWRAAYGRLAKSVTALEVIDAEQPAEDVLREAEARIWRRFGEIRARAGRRRRR